MKVLVTGVAGFIGSKVTEILLQRGIDVVGVDNFSEYYDVQLKKDRIKRIEESHSQAKLNRKFSLLRLDITDQQAILKLFADEQFDKVVHMAADAGARYSIENPLSYVNNNMLAFAYILEGCRKNQIQHLVYASSSSVYGLNKHLPLSVHDNTDHPLSLYASLKKSNELMAHSYSYLYNIPTTGLRFFTVYGPWDRPDMALQKFTSAILADEAIDVFNQGEHLRNFTYIDDIAEAVVRTLEHNAEANKHWNSEIPDPASSSAPWRIYNVGNQQPEKLMTYIETLEKHLAKKAFKNLVAIQAGDVQDTTADIDAFISQIGFEPEVDIDQGIAAFVSWYKSYYG